jgi:hypothetical protein
VSTVPKKTIADVDEPFRALVSAAPKEGDIRQVWRRIPSGQTLTLKDHERPYTVERAMLIEVDEVCDKWGQWETKGYRLNTAMPAPTVWQRIKSWLAHPAPPVSSMPVAKVVRR